MRTTVGARAGQTAMPTRLVDIGACLVGAVIVLIPFQARTLVVVGEHSPHLSGTQLQFSMVGLFEVLAIPIVVVASLLLISGRTRWTIAATGMATLTVITTVWWMFDPQWEPALKAIRFAAGTGLVLMITACDTSTVRRFVVLPFAASATLQAVWALGQTLLWDSGRSGREDLAGIPWTPGIGSLNHEYFLAAYLVLAIAVMAAGLSPGNRRHPLALSAVVLCGAAVATSFGRTAALALTIVVIVLLAGAVLRRSPWDAIIAGAPAVGFLSVATVTNAAWLERTNLESNVRLDLAERAIDIIERHPWFGVGPGGYGPALTAWSVAQDQFVVHSIPLLVAAEYGPAVGIAFIVWIGALGVAAGRRSVPAFAIFAASVPFLLLDNLHYVYSAGMALFGVWVALASFPWPDPNESAEGRIVAPGTHTQGTEELAAD